MVFSLAARHGLSLPYGSVDELRAAYDFTDLQSFLDVYYEAANVLLDEEDFFDMTWAYLQRAAQDGVARAEIFFDPQTHTDRGVPMATVIGGISRAVERAPELGVSAAMILCFLRHLPESAAIDTFEAAMPWKEQLIGIGLDSSEVGHPPADFTRVFNMAREEGLHLVAHAGEEGPPDYVWQALDVLGVERIDHGVRSIEDEALVRRLVADQIPLTTCPLSNLRLKVVDDLADHPLRTMLKAGLNVSINSDDPAYFGGYVADNYEAIQSALNLDRNEIVDLARNSLRSSFLNADNTVFGAFDAYVTSAALDQG